jgi:hypothetical protein
LRFPASLSAPEQFSRHLIRFAFFAFRAKTGNKDAAGRMLSLRRKQGSRKDEHHLKITFFA